MHMRCHIGRTVARDMPASDSRHFRDMAPKMGPYSLSWIRMGFLEIPDTHEPPSVDCRVLVGADRGRGLHILLASTQCSEL